MFKNTLTIRMTYEDERNGTINVQRLIPYEELDALNKTIGARRIVSEESLRLFDQIS